MKPNERRSSHPSESPAPKRRFRLMKLEDRIAPKKGGQGTNRGCGSASMSGDSVGY